MFACQIASGMVCLRFHMKTAKFLVNIYSIQTRVAMYAFILNAFSYLMNYHRFGEPMGVC